MIVSDVTVQPTTSSDKQDMTIQPSTSRDEQDTPATAAGEPLAYHTFTHLVLRLNVTN